MATTNIVPIYKTCWGKFWAKIRCNESSCLTGTRYPTRPDNFWQFPIRTRFFSRIIGYFGYRVFYIFLAWCACNCLGYSIHVGRYCFKPHNICQVWTCHQSSLQSIHSMRTYNRDVGTARYVQNSADHSTFCTILYTLILLFKKYAL